MTDPRRRDGWRPTAARAEFPYREHGTVAEVDLRCPWCRVERSLPCGHPGCPRINRGEG